MRQDRVREDYNPKNTLQTSYRQNKKLWKGAELFQSEPNNIEKVDENEQVGNTDL